MGMDPVGQFLSSHEALYDERCAATGPSMEAAVRRTGSAWFMKTAPISHPPPAAVFHPHETPPPAAQQPPSPPWFQQYNQYKQQFLPGQTCLDWDRLGSNYQTSFAGGLGGEDGQTAGRNNPYSQHSCSLRWSPQPYKYPSGLGHRYFKEIR